MVNQDYSLLVSNGNIGCYQSCEVTQLFLQNKLTKSLINFYTLITFEEKPYDGLQHDYLCKPIKVNDETSLGIQKYRLSLSEVENNFTTIIKKNVWNFCGDESLVLGNTSLLPKQFIPAQDGQRLSSILKNNFHNGSYIIEFFDLEKSHLDYLLKYDALGKLNKLNSEIKKYIPIDLSVARDRIGNIVFQFPINLFELSKSALASWNGIALEFAWHHSIKSIPDCLIQVESVLDNNFMGSQIVDYNKKETQEIIIGNIDQKSWVKIYRKNPDLLIGSFTGDYIRHITINLGVQEASKRSFEIDGELFNVPIHRVNKIEVGKDEIKSQVVSPKYLSFIKNTLYGVEAEKLETSLSFKQYFNGDRNLVLENIRKLILRNGEHGVYLWDPFLRAKDILETLFHMNVADVDMRAIGSITPTVKTIYEEKGKTANDIILQQRDALDISAINKTGLNLEFRLQYEQYGWAFHDRFLIFPGKNDDVPKAYSLGTSINSLGLSHHIVQEVSHPQRVIDAFDVLWKKIAHPNCIVWKYP